MFNTDARFVANFCQSSPANLAFCHAGVQCTIQIHTEYLDNIISGFKTNGSTPVIDNWKMKKEPLSTSTPKRILL